MTFPSLEQMLGQLFIIGFKGLHLSECPNIVCDIEKRYLGGVILFDRHLATKAPINNITGAVQLHQLTDDLQSLDNTKLLIAVDQEGGKVNRFREEFGFTLSASAKKLGDTPDTAETAQMARQVAQMLKNVGVNFNLAPVVDLDSNPTNPIIGKVERSFSADAGEVARHASVWIAEHRKADILTCLKHFPGHGSSEKDSHLGVVDISNSWKSDELDPYQQLINTGLVDAIMVGHLYHKEMDPHFPATLSRRIVTDLLRHEMHYTGIVISDDMQMKAITDRFGLAKACVMAIAAGVDMVIIGNNIDYDAEIFSRIHTSALQAIDNGTLSEDRVRSAWTQVNTLKSHIK
ncbi:glycoside hydrolase family 3 protein [Desulforhopalus sp. IMCC35007]|uniref:glycoside hydrolase family 3 protein n=1 Tax=Desulforhopalus sp. IMCC35007 TaxID=2569543 RepID=UPI0010AE7CB6|nr:glycoside hydrolase family 3 N-terminal domain-containing protein [Desulforhopalus sp. IMCC35007]TKB06272.1 glycoside hydrolase family 3 [Desulforhopalus sp. IMCC35007]